MTQLAARCCKRPDKRNIGPYFRRPDPLRPRAAGMHSWSKVDYCKLCNVPTGLQGDPEPIWIPEFGGGFDPAEMAKAFTDEGMIPPKIVVISVLGATNSPGDDADAEVALDIQWAAAAPSYAYRKPVTIYVIFAPNSTAGFLAAYKAGRMTGAMLGTNSWGGPEDQWGQDYVQVDAELAIYAGGGGTMFSASGDDGSADGERGQHTDFPGTSPHVVDVGGTTTMDSGEVAWPHGGGGWSMLYAEQAYQVGAPKAPGRTVPDCAANADPNTAYNVYLKSQWQEIGGTSGAAPWTAGCYSVILGQLKAAGKPSPGFLGPVIYQTTACFVDITQGSNGAFRASPGIDMVTGCGRMDVEKEMARLLGTTTAPTPPPTSNPPPTPPPVQPPVLDMRFGFISRIAHAEGLPVTTPARLNAPMGIG